MTEPGPGRNRRWVVAALVLAAAALILLIGIPRLRGGGSFFPLPGPAREAAEAAPALMPEPRNAFSAGDTLAPPAAPAAGAELYQRHCDPCHAIDHDDVGPAMLLVAKKYEGRPEALAAYLRQPVKIRVDSEPMPPVTLADPELYAVADYVLRLPVRAPNLLAPPSVRPAPPAPEAGGTAEAAPDIAPGEIIFLRHCAVCHDGERDDVGPSLARIAAKYRGRTAGLIGYLRAPARVDASFPEMPHPLISEAEARWVAEFLLAEAGPGETKATP